MHVSVHREGTNQWDIYKLFRFKFVFVHVIYCFFSISLYNFFFSLKNTFNTLYFHLNSI